MFPGTGSAKPGGRLFHSQIVGNLQNSAAYTLWKTGRSSQASGTLSRCWLCGQIGHRAVHCKKRTQVGSFQEKGGASGKPAAGVNNVKAEPVQCNRVVIEARNQSGTNLIGARLTQDIPDFRFPDSSVYKAVDQICEEIARKQANNADNATYFTSQLNEKFMELLGCKPRFSTVLHPEGNSLVERMNASLKKMLAHVSKKYRKQ